MRIDRIGDALRRKREEFDFALVDQVSPASEGIRIVRHLVRYNWPMPLIVLAQRTDMNCLHQAKELGAVEYLEKASLHHETE